MEESHPNNKNGWLSFKKKVMGFMSSGTSKTFTNSSSSATPKKVKKSITSTNSPSEHQMFMKEQKEQETQLISDIKEVFETLQIITGKPSVPLWKVAQEMRLSQVILYKIVTQFLKDHFDAGVLVEKKEKRYRNDSFTENLTGKAYTTEEVEKNLGFHIHAVYLNPKPCSKE